MQSWGGKLGVAVVALGGVASIVTIADSDFAGEVACWLWPWPLLAIAVLGVVALGVRQMRSSDDDSASRPRPVKGSPAGTDTDTFDHKWASIRLERDPADGQLAKLLRIMLLPEDAELAETPPDFSGFAAWAREQGADDVRVTPVRLTIQGKTEEAVLIVRMRAIIDSSDSPPKRGIPISRPTAGAVEIRTLTIDLEASQPIATAAPGSRGLPLTVSSADPEVIDIEVRATIRDVRWRLEIELELKGQREVVSLPEEPLRTIGLAPTPLLYEWPYGDNWVRAQRDPLSIDELEPGTKLEPLDL